LPAMAVECGQNANIDRETERLKRDFPEQYRKKGDLKWHM